VNFHSRPRRRAETEYGVLVLMLVTGIVFLVGAQLSTMG
jgi:hypothetical protein